MTKTLVQRLRDEYVQQSARCGEEDSQERSLLAQEGADEIERLRSALQKIACMHVAFPEDNYPGYASMALVTAREAIGNNPPAAEPRVARPYEQRCPFGGDYGWCELEPGHHGPHRIPSKLAPEPSDDPGCPCHGRDMPGCKENCPGQNVVTSTNEQL